MGLEWKQNGGLQWSLRDKEAETRLSSKGLPFAECFAREVHFLCASGCTVLFYGDQGAVERKVSGLCDGKSRWPEGARGTTLNVGTVVRKRRPDYKYVIGKDIALGRVAHTQDAGQISDVLPGKRAKAQSSASVTPSGDSIDPPHWSVLPRHRTIYCL